ncbi:MAG TPA: hypothetical protein VGD66_12780 [Allosphingosinicella sp.]|jgi:hypothetical protein
MNTRLTINLAAGIVEAEGPPELIERIYTDLRDTIVSRSSAPPPQEQVSPPADDANEGGEDEASKAKKPRRRGKSGPSCASRIQALKEEGYFSDLRSASEVGTKLREKGTAYEGKHIAASLIDLVRRGVLRRVSEGGSWSYQNP